MSLRTADDQAVFWRIIRSSTDPPIVPIGSCKHYHDAEAAKYDTSPSNALVPLVTCVLDPCVFSSGMLSRVWVPEYTYEQLLENVALRNETICAVHANYLSGNVPKMQRMQEYGFWLASRSGFASNIEAGMEGGKQKHHEHSHHHDSSDWGGSCLEYVFHNVSDFSAHRNTRRKLSGL